MSLERLIHDNPLTLSLSRKVLAVCYSLAPKMSVKIVYRLRLGRWPDLKNPQTFTEKIQWMRLYDHDPLKTKLADKYLVREWVTEKIGDEYLIPLLGVWDSFDEIDFDTLPEQFVLKANHGSGWNIIVRDKSQFDKREARKMCEKWLKTNYGRANFEPHYILILPKLIAEKYIENSDGNLYDYKVHCFGGKAVYIQYIGDRASHTTKEAFFDTEWNLMPFTYTYPRYEVPISKPDNLKELLSLSETLAIHFPYVRVDFYVLNDGSFRFGELTFTPAAGLDRWEPSAYDLKLGKLIPLQVEEL